MDRYGGWRVSYRPHGWVRLREDGDDTRFYLRFRKAGPAGYERFELQNMVAMGGPNAVLSNHSIRQLPLAEIERHIRDPLVYNALTDTSAGAPEPSLDGLEEFFEWLPADEAWEGVYGAEVVLDPHKVIDDVLGECPIVRKPADGRLTDEFLSDVAAAYNWMVAAKRNPAPEIANMSGAPVATVRRWISDARKRNLLPPATPGRAG